MYFPQELELEMEVKAVLINLLNKFLQFKTPVSSLVMLIFSFITLSSKFKTSLAYIVLSTLNLNIFTRFPFPLFGV